MFRFFYLQKHDQRAIVIMLCVIAAGLGLICLTNGRQQEETALKPTDAPLSTKPRDGNAYDNQAKPRKAELFPFDPNTADSAQLLRLGLRPWQVHNISRYRAAGGVFRQPSDFARLYGLTLKQYRQLEPYIRIKERFKEEHQLAANYFYAYEPVEERDTVRYPIKLQPEERVILNIADTMTLRKVPGIGSHFARKIVEYRQRLGGYYRVQQLMEITNFPETAVAFFIIPDSTLPFHRLNVNRLSLNELERHPYINFYQARAIIDFRRLYGRIESLQQLKLDRNFPPEAIERLEPYVDYE